MVRQIDPLDRPLSDIPVKRRRDLAKWCAKASAIAMALVISLVPARAEIVLRYGPNLYCCDAKKALPLRQGLVKPGPRGRGTLRKVLKPPAASHLPDIIVIVPKGNHDPHMVIKPRSNPDPKMVIVPKQYKAVPPRLLVEPKRPRACPNLKAKPKQSVAPRGQRFAPLPEHKKGK